MGYTFYIASDFFRFVSRFSDYFKGNRSLLNSLNIESEIWRGALDSNLD